MSRYEKIINYIFFIYIIVSPFLVIYGIKNPYEFPKFLFSIIVAQIIAILFIFNKNNFKLDQLNKLIFFYVAIIFIANIFGLDFGTSLIGSPWRHQGFLLLISGVIFYLVSRYCTTNKYIESSIILSGFILSLIAIFQSVLLNFGFIFTTYNNRIIATMGNPNFLSGYILLTLPFILFSNYLNKYKFAITWIYLIAIVLTESRSAILTFIIIIFFYIYHKIKVKYKFQISLLIIGLIIFLLSIFIVKIYNETFSVPSSEYKLNEFQRREYCLSHLPYHDIPAKQIRIFYETHPEILKRDSLCENRVIIWAEGIKAVIKKPFFGFGQENYELIFSKKLRFNVDNAHNLFLEILVSSGFIGLISFLLIIYFGFKKTKFKYKLFLLTFILISFLNPLFISGIILFWIVLGTANNSPPNKS